MLQNENEISQYSYIGVYIIRLFLGAFAGVMLANFLSDLFKGDPTIAKLGPGAVALVGGFSAEAVRRILNRLAEVLETVVRGQEDAATQERLSIAKDVLSIAETAANPQTPTQVKDQVTALLKKLQS